METELDGLYFSPSAKSASVIFYKDYNDITIYVEDEGKEYEYETIFKKLLGDQFRIERIFARGGKPALIEQYKSDKDSGSIENTIYIADGDFDRYVRPSKMVDCPNFIYLKAYNIENYYIDEVACVQYVKGKIKCLDNELNKRFNFKKWQTTIVEQSTKLFLVYCYLSKYYPTIPNVASPISHFLDIKTGFERKDGAFDKYFDEIKTQTGNSDYDIKSKINKIKKIYEEINGDDYYNLICGKFLLRSLSMHIRNISGSRFDDKDFRWHLINHFNISKLDYVRDAIIKAVS